jgi:hypothetical protein
MTSYMVIATALVGIALAAPRAEAQGPNEAEIKRHFEGKRVTLRIDMPGAADGVDIRVGRPFDAKQYGDRLRRFGTSIRSGETATITTIKVKKDMVEFQLDGGGYGTFGDDTSLSVNMPDVQKSNREKDLEAATKRETDATKKRALQRELDDIRNARERENRRIAVDRSFAEERKRAQVAERRLQGGSRFNVRFAGNVPATLNPNDIASALEEYVDFSPVAQGGVAAARPDNFNDARGGDGLPRKGMLRIDAERQFGQPVSVSERREGTLRVVTLVFTRGDSRITADFVEDVMIRYTIASR